MEQKLIYIHVGKKTEALFNSASVFLWLKFIIYAYTDNLLGHFYF